jgi:hypothetical protein
MAELSGGENLGQSPHAAVRILPPPFSCLGSFASPVTHNRCDQAFTARYFWNQIGGQNAVRPDTLIPSPRPSTKSGQVQKPATVLAIFLSELDIPAAYTRPYRRFFVGRHEVAGDRIREARHPGERDRSRRHQDADASCREASGARRSPPARSNGRDRRHRGRHPLSRIGHLRDRGDPPRRRRAERGPLNLRRRSRARRARPRVREFSCPRWRRVQTPMARAEE